MKFVAPFLVATIAFAEEHPKDYYQLGLTYRKLGQADLATKILVPITRLKQ